MSLSEFRVSRRAVLASPAILPMLGVVSEMAGAEPAWPAMMAAGSRAVIAGGKFYADGSVRPFPGCTIISHVRPNSALHDALSALLDKASTHPLLRKFTLLPKSSLHMTLIDGIDDEHRQPPLWPHELSLTASMQTAIEFCADRLGPFHTERTGDFRMVRRDISHERINGFTVPLQPEDAAREDGMRQMRDRISDLLGIREPNHSTYGFHVSLGYQTSPMSDEEAQTFRKLQNEWMDQLFSAVPVFTLGAPEFCVFKDMFAFDTQFVLKD